MYQMNDDMSIFVTRGDCCSFPIPGQFKTGDVVRFKVFRKKDCATVVMQRDFTVETEADSFVIELTGEDTKIGEVISKPTDYWYEVELNPDTYPQTIRGYDEDGAKIFRLYPEGKDVDAEDIEVVGKKTLQELVDYALEQAKESGEFDGKDGVDGKDGYTPVKGKDYLTEEEKAEFAEAVVEEAEQSCANALKATASGEIVRVDDVSPLTKTAFVSVRGKNYAKMSALLNGNLVDNGNDSYTLTKINGTRFSAEYVLDKPIPAGTLITASIATYQGTAPTMTIQVLKADRKDMYYFVVNASAKSKSAVLSYDVARVRVCFNSSEPDGVWATFSGLQLEVGEATEYEPYIDPSTVTLTKCGKNMLPNIGKSFDGNGITFTVNEDGSVTCNGTATKNAVINLTENYRLPLGTYILRGCPSTGGDSTYRLQTNKVINGEVSTGCVDVGIGSKLQITQECEVYSYIVVLKDTTVSNVTFYPQLLPEAETDTAYEPYNGTTYTPAADGTCNIVPASPTMTLFADTPGVNIEVEYSQDTNKAMQNVHSELQELDRVTGNLITDVGDIETALDGIIAIQNGLLGGDAV